MWYVIYISIIKASLIIESFFPSKNAQKFYIASEQHVKSRQIVSWGGTSSGLGQELFPFLNLPIALCTQWTVLVMVFILGNLEVPLIMQLKKYIYIHFFVYTDYFYFTPIKKN